MTKSYAQNYIDFHLQHCRFALSRREYAVFCYVVDQCNTKNYTLLKYHDIAENIGTSKNTVHRAMKTLLENNFILRSNTSTRNFRYYALYEIPEFSHIEIDLEEEKNKKEIYKNIKLMKATIDLSYAENCVFNYAIEKLNFSNFRELPITDIAADARVGRTRIMWAINKLLKHKFIVSENHPINKSRYFRLDDFNHLFRTCVT